LGEGGPGAVTAQTQRRYFALAAPRRR